MQINRRFYSAFCLLLIFHQKQHEIRLYLFKPRVSLLCIVSMNTLIELDSTITGDKIPPFYPFFFSATSHCCCSQQSAADDIFRDITDIFICHQTRSFTHLKGRLLTHSVTPVWVTSIRMEFCFLSWYIKLFQNRFRLRFIIVLSEIPFVLCALKTSQLNTLITLTTRKSCSWVKLLHWPLRIIKNMINSCFNTPALCC